MATVKKSKKMKIIIPICIVLVIAVAAGSIFAVSQKNKVPVVSLTTIGTDNIVESVSATGTVSSSTSREYSAATIANCKEVFVKVGDKVNHKTFGDGKVISINGKIAEIAFALPTGIKKMLSTHPSLTKIN